MFRIPTSIDGKLHQLLQSCTHCQNIYSNLRLCICIECILKEGSVYSGFVNYIKCIWHMQRDSQMQNKQ